MENPNYKPAIQEANEIELEDDLTLDGVVDIDLDEFLSGMNTSGVVGVVEKKVIQDPYNQKSNGQNTTIGQSYNNSEGYSE